MKRLIIFLTIIIIHLICGLDSDLHFQSKYSRYEFILHKCIASAQLNRKHQIAMQEKNSTARQVQSPTVSLNLKLNNSHPFNNSKTTYNNVDMEHYLIKRMENTPLRTLNIKTMQRLLPIFTKKDLLPELEKVTNKTTNSSHSIILIKSAT
ncbi:uncharacterized protein LOC126868037 [Bombus huntii]|uniref:uncharacterized protein LOC126868037 n=1 Tax=Bombus huntii TaxID=85661 RepID=UPI0021AADCD1|nr:uncharacterized protein LOC126868037 [Bombus huntii]XP_050479143.1 uncharacterized protein LOC126868037 [Bombus huntii]